VNQHINCTDVALRIYSLHSLMIQCLKQPSGHTNTDQ